MVGLKMKYFVLKPKGNNKYAAASRYAMKAYAKKIIDSDPELAEELVNWANKETLNVTGDTK